MKSSRDQNYYELLEVAPTASPDEIRSSYERLHRMLDPENVALYPVFDPSQIEQQRSLILEAVEFLSDPDLRIEYDRSIGLPSPFGSEAEPGARIAASGEAPSAPIAEPVTTPHSTLPNLNVSWIPHAPPPVRAGPSSVTLDPGAMGATVAAHMTRSEGRPAQESPATDQVGSTLGAMMMPAASTPAVASAPAATSAPAVASGPVESSAASRSIITPAGSPSNEKVGEQAPRDSQATEVVRPATRGLEQAQLIAQESAIAAAESALAQVSMQVSTRSPREVRPRQFEIPADAEFNGELLRQIRQSKGLSVHQLADRTRISSRHIENVEADRYDALPTTVYLRGFLMSIARELGVDSLRVSKSYLNLVARQLGGSR